MTIQEELIRLVKTGATATVRFDDGMILEEAPVQWLKLEGSQLRYMLAGPETREHIIDIDHRHDGEDAEHYFETRLGYTVIIAPVWNDEQRAYLERWKDLDYNYPEGGAHYGQV